MTLDIQRLFKNVIEKQLKINHFDCKIKIVKSDKVPASVKTLITDQYGQKYLDDADYVAFFWGNISKDNVSKLFKVVDTALGGSANKMTDTDFKLIKMDDNSDAEDNSPEEEDSDEVEDTTSNDSDSEEEEEVVDSTDDSDSEEDVDLDKEIDDVINEDDDFSDEEEPVVHNRLFLKITIK